MKLQDFGFKAVPGNSYTVTFTSEGKLIKTLEYNGTPITALKLPDRTKVTITVTDRVTGKEVFENDLYQYNGKLYNAVVYLPLTSGDNNMNANVYIKDLHYDLASGNILIGVQGFSGESYSITVADITTNHKVLTMPITLTDNTYYSLSTEMVQGNRFEVTLSDAHNVPLDLYDFTAPLTTSYRYTDTGVKELDTVQAPTADLPDTTEQPVNSTNLGAIDQGQTGVTNSSTQQPTESLAGSPDSGGMDKGLLVIGGIIIILIIIGIILFKPRKKEEVTVPYDLDEEDQGEDESTSLDEVAAGSENYVEPEYEEANPDEGKYDPRASGDRT